MKYTTLKLLFVFTILAGCPKMLYSQDRCTTFCENDTEKEKCIKKCKKNLRSNVIIEHSIFDAQKNIFHTIDAKSQIVFKLKDINTFLYKVTLNEIKREAINSDIINNKNIKSFTGTENFKKYDHGIEDFSPNINRNDNGDTELPKADEKKKINIKNKIDFDIKNLENDTVNLETEKTKLSNKLDNLESLKLKFEDSINDSINKLKEKYGLKNLENEKDYNNRLEGLLEENKTAIETNIIELNEKNRELIYKKEQLKNLEDADALSEILLIEYDYRLNLYLKTLSNIHKKILFYEELLLLLYSDEKFKDIEREKKELLKLYYGNDKSASNIVYDALKQFDVLNEHYNDIKSFFDKSAASATDSAQNYKQLEKSYNDLVKYHNTIDQTKYKDLFIEIKKVYEAINEKNWTITHQTTDIPDRYDKLFYTIKLEKVQNNYTLSNNTVESFNYDFEIDKGIKVDFSAGIFYHFGLRDEKFRLERDDTNPNMANIIKEENNADFVPSIGGLLNVYKRSNANTKLTLNFGGGTNIEKTFFYLGGGLLFGKSERVGLSFGVVGGSVNRISGEYRNLNSIDIAEGQDLNDITISTEDVYRIGGYIGVTYNLSKKNDDELKKSLSNFLNASN